MSVPPATFCQIAAFIVKWLFCVQKLSQHLYNQAHVQPKPTILTKKKSKYQQKSHLKINIYKNQKYFSVKNTKHLPPIFAKTVPFY